MVTPGYARNAVQTAARVNRLHPDLINAVILIESNGNPNATSSVGAGGFMQIMGPTGKDLGLKPNNPLDNIRAGSQYLRQMLNEKNGDLEKALASYNAGGGRVNNAVRAARINGDDWRTHLPKETVNYLHKFRAVLNDGKPLS